MRDHLFGKIEYYWQSDQHFSIIEPATRPPIFKRPYVYGQWGGLSRRLLLYSLYYQYNTLFFQQMVPSARMEGLQRLSGPFQLSLFAYDEVSEKS